MFGTTGYDRYLEWQMGYAGDFNTALFTTISLADEDNLRLLERAFPDHVRAHITWTQFGVAMFSVGVSTGHPLLVDLQKEHSGDLGLRLALESKQ